MADNTAENSGGGIFANAGLINLLGGTVSGNQAGRFGGGILTSPYTSVRLGYGPGVNGNVGGNRYFDNLYLDGHVEPPGVDGEQVPGEGTDITQPMAIGFGLQEGVSIGVSRWVRPDEEHTYRVVAIPANRHNIDENDLSRFSSDDPAYIVLLHGGNIVLTHADVVFDTQGHGVTPPGQPFGNDHKVTDPGDLSEKGYTFGGWYQEPECNTPWDFDNSTITVDREEPLVLYAKWELIPYAINYQLDGGNNAAANPGGYTIESDTIILQQPTKAGYTFLGWTWPGEDTPQTEVTIPAGSIDDREYTAHWQKRKTSHSSSGRPKPQPEEEKLPYVPPALASEEHFAYIMGYPDGNVRPEANISRAEVAAIFFRLMTDDFRAENAAAANPFPDVNPGSWYNNAVSTAARAGLIRGLPDGTFAGERPITRAEFAAIAARFLSDETAPDSGFADMAGHWAADEVSRAVAAGWIKGFPDGGFHPGDYITRAEVVTMVNRMLGRTPNAAGMREDMAVWPDNLPAAWYYADVQEATNGHTYERDGASAPETWTGLTANRDWTELEH